MSNLALRYGFIFGVLFSLVGVVFVALSAFNLAGNAWEWTADWYDSQLYRQAVKDDPHGPKIPTERAMERALRGGSWAGAG
jgi:formylglycine-generating enzyme required for sulfatase activity